MTKFIFKSNASDLQKISQSIETLQSNILYLTYRMDACLKKLNELTTDKGLQHQVDEYFDEANRATAGLEPEDFKDDKD